MIIDMYDFFDPHNKEHMDAYLYLKEYGCWPTGFINGDLKPTWFFDIQAIMANAWVNHFFSEEQDA